MIYRASQITAKAEQAPSGLRWHAYVDGVKISTENYRWSHAMADCRNHVDHRLTSHAWALWDGLERQGIVTLKG